MSNTSRNEPEDPFEGLVLDEEFILAARKREPSAQDRLSRAAALRENLTESERIARQERRLRHRLTRGPRTRTAGSLSRSPERRNDGSRRRRLMVAVVVVVSAAALVWWETGHREKISWQGGDPMLQLVDAQNRPTPTGATSDIPLGSPDPAPPGGGPHVFMATQEDGTTPVAYDPCRPITVVVNESTMPPAATGVVDEAIHEVSEITGLRFVVEGSTDERATEERAAFQPDRYGDRWAPVLIAWSGPAEHPELAGDVAGLGGSSAIRSSDSKLVYVSGIVYLDGPDVERILERPDGREQTRAIVLHELGHLLGLAHVDDPEQLMYERNSGRADFEAGDLTGLIALSRGTCFDRL